MVEELKLAGKPIKAWFYSRIEKFCFKNSSLNVYVSEVMQSHYRTLYPAHPGEDLIFAPNSSPSETDCLKQPITNNRQLISDDNKILFIYSGNSQKWQNIGLMLDCIQRLDNPNYEFLILSGQKKRFERLIKRKKITAGKIRVISVQPEELDEYYKRAHYGFILRDDILVNRVANPTKLAEYLQYGIIPIVKLVEIGDYADYNYEFLRFEHLTNDLQPRKSQKNRAIYAELSRKFGCVPLQRALFRIQNRYITPSKACNE
jgi:hypothetical protein